MKTFEVDACEFKFVIINISALFGKDSVQTAERAYVYDFTGSGPWTYLPSYNL